MFLQRNSINKTCHSKESINNYKENYTIIETKTKNSKVENIPSKGNIKYKLNKSINKITQ